MEYMAGGELSTHMSKRGKAHKEGDVKTIVHRMLRGGVVCAKCMYVCERVGELFVFLRSCVHFLSLKVCVYVYVCMCTYQSLRSCILSLFPYECVFCTCM